MKKTIFPFLLLCLILTNVQADIVSGKTYVITSALDGLHTLFVQNSSTEDQAGVVLWSQTGVPAEQWEASVQTSGSVIFKNIYTGMYLGRKTLNGKTVTCQMADASLSAIRWKLNVVDGSPDSVQLAYGTSLLTATNPIKDGDLPFISMVKTGSDAIRQTWLLKEVTPAPKLTRNMRNDMMQGFLTQFLRSRGTGLSTFGDGGGWGDAEMLETMLDAYETTGDESYLNTFTAVFSYFKKYVGNNWLTLVYNDNYKWYGHDFNDDVMWMILASVRAYMLTATTSYLTFAKQNFDGIYSRALNQWGMLRWAQISGNVNGTNSCINGPAEVAACYLGLATGDETYFTKARNLYANQRLYLFVPSSGKVYDSFIWDANTNKPGSYNYWSSTYNQGTMLGAAVMLYNHYGNAFYKQDAEHIMDFTVKNLCNADGYINACQVADGDLCGFKGILMRYVRKFITSLGEFNYEPWMRKNALLAYNNRNSKNITCSVWLTKSGEDFKFGDTDFSNQPFGCSTALSALFNTSQRETVYKKANDTIEAEYFDGMRKINVTENIDCSGGYMLSNIKQGYFVNYAQVDFGSQPALWAQFKVSEPRTQSLQCSIEIYLDSLNGACIGTAQVPTTAGWKLISTSIQPTSGVHTVYLKFLANSALSTNCFNLDYFFFSLTQPDAIKTITAQNSAVKVYSDAVDNVLHVTVPAQASINIFNAAGQLLATYTLPEGSSQLPFRQDFKGLYLVRVNVAGNSYLFKILGKQ
jgi:predicted alpha-1,6-mannanase (GH76 family)